MSPIIAGAATYELTPEQAFLLADERSPVFMPPIWEVIAAAWADEAKTIEAFRTGKGVSWGEHDGRLHCGVAAFYRNGYRASLVAEWLPALDGVVAKLEAGARVADIGCGHGHSTLLMAEAFPKSRFLGFDTHKGSIEAAQAHAREAGLVGPRDLRAWRTQRSRCRGRSISSVSSTACMTSAIRSRLRAARARRWPRTAP